MDSLRDRVRAYVQRAQASSAQADHDRWRRQQPEWEQRWDAPSAARIRDGIFAILDRHGVLDPAAPRRFADIGAGGPVQDWGPAVFAGAVSVGAAARAVIRAGGDGRPRDGADFARLVTPFAAVTGGDWRPAGLRTSHVLPPGGGGGRVLVDFEHAGQPHHWELHQAPEDGLTPRYLDCVRSFARAWLPGELLIHDPGSGETTVTYVPAGPAGEVRAFLRGWPSGAQLVAMVREDAAGTWGERGGNRVFVTSRRLGLETDYNAPAPDGVLPLHEAARLGQAATVRFMLRGGADPLRRDVVGRQAADLARDPELRDYIASWAERGRGLGWAGRGRGAGDRVPDRDPAARVRDPRVRHPARRHRAALGLLVAHRRRDRRLPGQARVPWCPWYLWRA